MRDTGKVNLCLSIHVTLQWKVYQGYRLVSDFLQTGYRLVSDWLETGFRLVSDWFQTGFRLVSDWFQTSFRLVAIANWSQTGNGLVTDSSQCRLIRTGYRQVNRLFMDWFRSSG